MVDRQALSRKASKEAKKEAQKTDRQKAYESMASAGIKSLSGAVTGDKKGREAEKKQRDEGFKPISDYPKGDYTVGADIPTKVTEDKKEVLPEKEVTFFKGYGNVSPLESKLINKLKKRGLNDAAILMALKQAKFSDENLIDLMSGEGWKKLIGGVLDKSSLFEKPEYEHDFLGSAGAANIIKKLESIKGKTDKETAQLKQNYVNQIIEANPKGFQEIFGEYTTKVNPNEFINALTSANAGNKNFDRVMDPDSYYALNPPTTLGDMEEMLGSGITMTKENTQMIQEARNRVSEAKDQSQGLAAFGGGGGGGGVTPTDPTTDPTKVPDYVLKQQYMPGFTPSYTGGAEQMHIAGGYWDPRTQKWIGSGPWGTTGQYQFPITTMAQGGIVGTSPLLFKNQGGMVNDNGIKAFKKYGY